MRDGSLFTDDWRLTFTDAELEAVLRPIAPGPWGGHQQFEHELQQRVHGRTLVVTDDELVKAYRYGYRYGAGTWQTYMRAIVSAAWRAGWVQPE